MLLIPKYETANFKSRDKRVMKSRPQGVDSLDAYVVEALGGARSLVSEKEFMPFLYQIPNRQFFLSTTLFENHEEFSLFAHAVKYEPQLVM